MKEQSELVAAESRGRVRGRQLTLESFRHLHEQAIPCNMTKAIVDGLEVVDVDQRHGQEATGGFLGRSCSEVVGQSVEEQRAVREAGQRIGEGLAPELVLKFTALGHVPAVEHDAAHFRVGQQVASHHLEPAPASIGMPDANLTAVRAGRIRSQPREGGAHPIGVLRMHEVGQRPVRPGLARLAQDRADGGADVARGAVFVHQEHEVGRVLDEGAETCLAGSEAPREVGQEAVRTPEGAPQQGQQDEPKRANDEQHVPTRAVDGCLQRPRILVHLVGADDASPGAPRDWRVDLEDQRRERALEHVLVGIRRRDRGRRLSVKRLVQVVLDLEAPSAESRQVAKDNGPVAPPDLDPEQPPPGGELLQLPVHRGGEGRVHRIRQRGLLQQRVHVAVHHCSHGAHSLVDAGLLLLAGNGARDRKGGRDHQARGQDWHEHLEGRKPSTDTELREPGHALSIRRRWTRAVRYGAFPARRIAL